MIVVVVGGTPAGMTRVILAASCDEHARKQKENGVPWGGVRMLRRCEAGKETSRREIRGGEKNRRCGVAAGCA